MTVIAVCHDHSLQCAGYIAGQAKVLSDSAIERHEAAAVARPPFRGCAWTTGARQLFIVSLAICRRARS